MKKLITSIILSGVFFAASAQQTFKPIHFTFTNKFWGKGGLQKGMADGIININPKDSVITINDTKVSTFKFYQLQPETTSSYEGKISVKNLTFYCKDQDNATCAFKIFRQTQPGKKDAMEAYVIYAADTYTVYTCDFLKEL
jgi:ribosomal protein L24